MLVQIITFSDTGDGSRVFLPSSLNVIIMRKNQTAGQASANPLLDFIKRLPQSAPVLGFKIHHSTQKVEFCIAYLFKGQTIHQTICMKGGKA